MTGDAHILYKVVEVAPVTEDTIEDALEVRAAERRASRPMRFVTREGSRRPAMACLLLTRVREPRPPSSG